MDDPRFFYIGITRNKKRVDINKLLNQKLKCMKNQKPLSKAQRPEQPPGVNTRRNKVNRIFALLIMLMAFTHIGKAQNNCSSAVDAFVNSVCIAQTTNFAVSQTEYWFKIEANPSTFNVTIFDYNFPQQELQYAYLYSGTCSSLNLLAGDTITPTDSILSFNIENTTIGITYYVKVVRSIIYGDRTPSRFEFCFQLLPTNGHTAVVCQAGTIQTMGNNTSFQRGLCGQQNECVTTVGGTLLNANDIVATEVGEQFTLALNNIGEVYIWGNSIGSFPSSLIPCPTLVPLCCRAVQISAGFYHAIVLLENGEIALWGYNQSSQLGISPPPTGLSYLSPVYLTLPQKVVYVAAGHESSYVILEDNTVMAWGNQSFGALGNGVNTGVTATPQFVQTSAGVNLTDIVKIETGFYFAVALSNSGQVYVWGDNSVGAIGLGNTNQVTYATPSLNGILDISANIVSSFLLASSNTYYAAGSNQYGSLTPISMQYICPGNQPGTKNTYTPAFTVPLPTGASSILRIEASVPYNHSWIIFNDGQVYTFGSNNANQLGECDINFLSSCDYNQFVIPEYIDPITGNPTPMCAAKPNANAQLMDMYLQTTASDTLVCSGAIVTLCTQLINMPSLTPASCFQVLWSNGATTLCTQVSPTVTTTYTVSFTYCDSTYTDSITIYVSDPQIHAHDYVLCQGNNLPFPICADSITGATPPYTYLWLPSGFTSECIQVNPVNGAYTLIVTDSVGCKDTAQIQVIINTVAIPDIDGSDLGCSEAIYTNLNFDPSLVYVWSAPSGITVTPSGNGSEATIGWAVNVEAGWIYLSATDTLTGCTAIDSFYVNTCCALDNPFTGVPINFENTTASFVASVFGTNVITAGNIPVNFNGTFTIDIPIFIFAGSTNIRMGENAKIIILPGNNLRIVNSVLRAACPDKMWDGIYANTSNSSLEIISSELYDGINTVHLENGVFVQINNSLFDLNYDAVTLKNVAGAYNNASIIGNTFTNTAGLKQPYAGMRGNLGVHAFNIGGSLLGLSLNNNTYNHLNYGIFSENSTVAVNSSTFTNLTELSSTEPGMGIYANNFGPARWLRVNFAGLPSQKNIFNNCGYGVIVEGKMSVTVNRNDFDDITGYAISVSNVAGTGGNSLINLNNNTIRYNNANYTSSVVTTGINLYNNANANLTVNNNTINMNALQNPIVHYGIRGNEIPQGSNSSTTVIENNSISRPRFGIHVTGYNNLTVRNNNITQIRAGIAFIPASGVWVNSSTNATVISNTAVTTSAHTNLLSYGVRMQDSDNLVRCNSTARVGVGLMAWGLMPVTQFWDNSMNNHNNGWRLAGNSLLPTQAKTGNTPTDNRWIGNNFGCRTVTINPLSLYVRSTTLNSLFNPQQGTNINCNYFNAILSSGLQFQCPPIIVGGVAKQLQLMQQIAQGNIGADDTLKWIARHAAWREIKRDNFYQQYSDLFNFADSTDNANLGALSRLDSLINDTLIGISPQALADLQNIMPNNDREENMRDVLEAVFEKTVNNQSAFSPAQIVQLQRIAAMCPLRGGLAVYQARVLLSQIDTTFYINECELDFEAEPRNNMFDEEENPLEEVYVQMHPNPANDVININVFEQENTQTNYVIEIYDMLGKKVYNQTHPNKTITIDVKHYQNGVYLINIISNNQLIYIDKLIINK